MPTRRTVLGASASLALLAGCLGDDDEPDDEDDEDDPSYETRLDELEEYDVVDLTDEDAVEIAVDPDGERRFDPDPIVVEQYTDLTWSWEGTGYELYPVWMPDPCGWDGDDSGGSHSWQFPFVGKYEIGCETPDGETFTGVVFVVEEGTSVAE